MSGINQSDQILSYHARLRKIIRWHKKVGTHMRWRSMEILMANAFYLYTKNTAPCISGVKDSKESIINLIGPANQSNQLRPQASFH